MKSTLAQIETNTNINEIPSQNDSFDDTRPRIWLRIPFMGKQGEFFVKKKLLKKIQRNLIQPVKFVIIYDAKKISYFLPKKDKTTAIFSQSHPGQHSNSSHSQTHEFQRPSIP